uniref:Uncharacterized protein n=1 Tax=Arundo donax TaxID=35708 RepID=A0A0A9AZA5_ARUDO
MNCPIIEVVLEVISWSVSKFTWCLRLSYVHLPHWCG